MWGRLSACAKRIRAAALAGASRRGSPTADRPGRWRCCSCSRGRSAWPSSSSPSAPSSRSALVGAAGMLAVLGACGVWLLARRIPMVGFGVLAACGSVVTSAMVAHAATHGGMMIAAFSYPWIAIYSAHFFPRRVVIAQGTLISVGFGVGLLVGGLPDAGIYWGIVDGHDLVDLPGARSSQREPAPSGRHRSADGPAQPQRLPGGGGARARDRSAQRQPAHAGGAGPRRLQADQRPARPRGRRSSSLPISAAPGASACAQVTSSRVTAATSSCCCCPPPLPTAPRRAGSPARRRSCGHMVGWRRGVVAGREPRGVHGAAPTLISTTSRRRCARNTRTVRSSRRSADATRLAPNVSPLDLGFDQSFRPTGLLRLAAVGSL